MSKKRQQNRRARKNHSVVARDQRLFANCRLWTWEGLASPVDGEQFVTAERWTPFGWVTMGPDLAEHLVKRQRNWSIGVRALCRSGYGVMWMESCTFDLPSHNLQQIEGAYHKLRADVLSAQRTSHVYDLGWICQTWTGQRPEDPLELWHYHGAPADMIRQATSDDRQIRRMAGPEYSQERYDRWQQVNREYLEERKQVQEQESAA